VERPIGWYSVAGSPGEGLAAFQDANAAYKKGDYAQAVFWWRKAADYGDAVAQFSLGFMYLDGQGVPRDYIQAHMWWNPSASQTSIMRDFAVKRRDEVAAEMTASQIAEEQRLASVWKPKN
jgi:uncharacterized protein